MISNAFSVWMVFFLLIDFSCVRAISNMADLATVGVVDSLSKTIKGDHFASLFAAELFQCGEVATEKSSTEETSIMGQSTTFGDRVYDINGLQIPEIVLGVVYNRLSYITSKLQLGSEIDLQFQLNIVHDILEISAKRDEFQLDEVALARIREETEVDLKAISKLKLAETCLLRTIFPYMREQCEGPLRDMLADHLKIWVEVWKKQRSNLHGWRTL